MTTRAASLATIAQPLRERDFFVLWSGMTISLLGDGIFFVALPWLVLDIVNSPNSLAVIGIAWTLPSAVASIAGGVLSDRMDRRHVMVIGDLLRGGAIGAMALLVIAESVELWHVFVLMLLFGIGEGIFMPAFGAIVADVVPRHLLVQANALDQLVRPLVWRLAGPAAGGLLLAVSGTGGALAINAVSFVVSCGCILAVRARPAAPAGDSEQSALRELGDGFRFVRSERWLAATLLASAFVSFLVMGAWNTVVPYVIKNALDGGSVGYGMTLAAGGVGAVAAALWLGSRPLPERPVTAVLLAWSLMAFGLVGFAVATSMWHAFAASFLVNFGLSGGAILWGAAIQTFVPSGMLGRVASIDWFVASSVVPLSFVAAAAAADALGASPTLLVAGIAGGVGTLAFRALPQGAEIRAPRSAET